MKSISIVQDSLKLKPQECGGSYKFSGQLVMTRGFLLKFGDPAAEIAVCAIMKVITERVNSPEGADYLQIPSYKGTPFWIIDDVDVVTVLLPSEY